MGAALFAENVFRRVESDACKYGINASGQIELSEQNQPPETMKAIAELLQNFWNDESSRSMKEYIPYFKERGIIPTVFVGNVKRLLECTTDDGTGLPCISLKVIEALVDLGPQFEDFRIKNVSQIDKAVKEQPHLMHWLYLHCIEESPISKSPVQVAPAPVAVLPVALAAPPALAPVFAPAPLPALPPAFAPVLPVVLAPMPAPAPGPAAPPAPTAPAPAPG